MNFSSFVFVLLLIGGVDIWIFIFFFEIFLINILIFVINILFLILWINLLIIKKFLIEKKNVYKFMLNRILIEKVIWRF